MSSTGRTTSKGGKGAKAERSHKSDGNKVGGDKIHNKENTVKHEELSMKEKVKTILELTQCTEDEACSALHENANNLELAVVYVLEELVIGEWETKDKKKKKRQASTGKDKKIEEAAGGTEDWDESQSTPQGGNNNGGAGDNKEWKERGGGRRDNKSGGPPRRFREDGGSIRNNTERRPGPRGPTRPGGTGRGRGGGRAGGRYPPRGNRTTGSGGGKDYNRQPIDTWDNSNTWDNSTAAATTNHAPAADEWDEFHTDEWSTEEYTGSLVETKVFTPSVQTNLEETVQGQTLPTLDQNLGGPTQQDNTYSQTYNQTVPQLPTQHSPVPPMVGTLTAAQTQYFSQLSQQNSDALGKSYANSAYQQNAYDSKSNIQQVYNSSSQIQGYGGAQQSYGNAAQSYNSAQQSSYGTTSQQAYGNPAQASFGGQGQSFNNAVSQAYGTTQQTYGAQGYQGGSAFGSGPDVLQAQPPQRTKTQRARVPPPSKIPASAVEMPGDLNSSITYLDVQFGAMDLIDSSFDSNAVGDKYGSEGTRSAGGLDNSRTTPTNLDLETSSRSASNHPGDSGYGSGNTTVKNGTQSSISSALSQGLSNTDSIPQTSEHLNYNSASTNRNPSQGSSASTSVPSVTAAPGLDLNKQTDSSHSYNSQAAAYNSFQSKANTYNTPYNTTQAYQNASSYPVTQASNSYQASGQSSYASSGQNPTYGANTGLSSNPNFTPSTGQYNSYNSSGASKIGSKDNSYDSVSTNSATNTNTTSSNAAMSNTTALSSLTQTTISTTKSTTALAKNSTSIMSNIPPNVAPVMSTPYIMSQVPYYQQPVYSYEEMQLLQQRMPHMTTPYYDMGYQTPTTLATVRDPTNALGGYGAATADGRFQTAGRAGDGTTSPVPAASQQQQQQQPPILAAAAGTGPPYFFATAFNTIAAAPPNYAQFGTMYTPLPTVTNAHGSSANSQYGPKPTTYGSAGYGAYDALGQSAQDYTKGGYTVGSAAAVVAAAQQAAQKGQTNSTSAGSAANDLSAMYGKSHAALGKVNSYEKQGFHSGTPPPFTGALGQSAGLAPSGTGYAPQVYIPTMAQHHSTMAMHQPLHQMDVRHQGRRAVSHKTTHRICFLSHSLAHYSLHYLLPSIKCRCFAYKFHIFWCG
ncbi:hypothetical protein ABEB36_002529 [Hypothenemus hampei]|uniref:Protein lingerer n=1 Tax=Hypothenemus hampei TaxID=57062 RepID=A0ABD1F8N6_HYPHA